MEWVMEHQAWLSRITLHSGRFRLECAARCAPAIPIKQPVLLELSHNDARESDW
jgi:hypothetical protein